jgi:hypothetical protein
VYKRQALRPKSVVYLPENYCNICTSFTCNLL